MSDSKNKKFASENDISEAGWMSGNMAQLTVFLTGLILAVTAYALLNVLIQEMIKSDLKRHINTAQQSISENLGRLEQTITIASLISEMPEIDSDEKLKEKILSFVEGLSDFDHVLWLKPSSNHEWKALNVLMQDSPHFSKGALKNLVHIILAKREEENNAVIVITNPPGSEYQYESTDPLIKEQPFILAKIVTVSGRDVGMIVGSTRISRVFDKVWLNSGEEISRLVVRDAESKQHLYYMNRDTSGNEYVNLNDSGENSLFKMGGNEWQFNILLGKSRQTAFFENMPWLMLVFGIALTLFGTLYVRNNQSHSHKLSVVKRKLAQKNYELSSEVSERERLDLAVSIAEREYRNIIDSVSDIIFETSIDGEIVFLNETWQKITGFEIEQVTGRNIFDLLHPQDQEEQHRNFSLLVQGKKTAYRSFTRLRTSEGAFRSVELAMSTLRQDKNHNMRVVGTITDVEERRRAEKALSEAEKKYRTIVENAAGGIYQVTPEGQFLSANPAMARILGHETPEQMLREIKNVHDNLYLSSKDRADFIRKLEISGVVHNFETEVKTRDGSRIWVNENARAVKDEDGSILYYEGSMEDITSRKQTEMSLQEAKLESDLASRAKSEFLTNMSHELRTPLNAIIGFAEIIKDEVLGPLENKQYWDYARDIHESGYKLLNIINEILDVSRIEAGDRQINDSIVNIDEIVSSCVGFMAQKAETAELVVKNMMAGKVPNVIGEELAIKQIIINLLGNAIKYTPPEGRVTLSHEIEGDGCLRVSITDTGIGMDEREIEKALSAFGQVETSLSRTGSGAGLGLTLVNSLIELHGGELEIFSQKGVGTTASIVFPATRVINEDAESRGGASKTPKETNEGAHRIH